MCLRPELVLGLLISAVTGAWGAPPPNPDSVPRVPQPRFDIAYDINDAARPLRTVELWYTLDEGQTWRLYGIDEDRVSPVTFTAEQEGLHGFYLLISNAAGVSGPPPTEATEPHFRAFVDHTPPVAQLQRPTLVRRSRDLKIVELRWSALDDHLGNRPIDLAYRTLPDGTWRDVQTNLPNTGRYDWHIPVDLQGEVMFRMTVRDRGGHAVQCASKAIAIQAEPTPDPSMPEMLNEEYTPLGDPPTPTAAEMQRARELLRKGRRHALQGEHALAAARLREALELDPRMPEALVELGGALYALNQFEPSVRAYDLALRQTPQDRSALEGIARSLMALNKHSAAEAKLLEIVESDPKDVETWLHLGDVAIYRGNEVAARDYYLKAATLRPEARSVADRARARLDDLPAFRRGAREPIN